MKAATIQLIEKEGIAIVIASGGILADSGVDELKKRLIEAHGRDGHVILDLTGVVYLSSAALGSLVTCHRRQQEHGRKLAIHGTIEDIMQVVRMAALDQKISFVSTREEAVASVMSV